MRAEFQEQHVSILGESIKAEYLFHFFPMIANPIEIHAQVVAAIPDPVFVGCEDAIKGALWAAATAKLEELEQSVITSGNGMFFEMMQ